MNNGTKPPIAERIADRAAVQEALGEAVLHAILTHAKLGYPVATWRDGKVVWISPEEILAQYGTNGEASAK